MYKIIYNFQQKTFFISNLYYSFKEKLFIYIFDFAINIIYNIKK